MAILSEEDERYDRQIRLWGAEAQNNLRNANILIIGLTGLGSEIVKNVVLSGIKSLVLVDNRKITEMPKGQVESQMLVSFDKKQDEELSIAELSLSRCYELNPSVETTCVSEIPFDKIKEIETKNFQIVITCDQKRETELAVYAACKESNTPFLTGKTAGYFGQAIIDCGTDYKCQVPKPKIAKEEILDQDNKKGEVMEDDDKKDEEEDEGEAFQEETFQYDHFSSLISKFTDPEPLFKKLKNREAKNLNQALIIINMLYENLVVNEENVKEFSQKLSGKSDLWEGKNLMYHNLEELEYSTQGQLAAVTAVVGGFMAQEVIRVASKKEKPFENVFLFDGLNYKGDVMKI